MAENAQRAATLPTPDRMREAVAAYVMAVHEAYLRQAATLPVAAQGRLPLLAAGPFSVAAVGTRFLHLVATADPLGSAGGAAGMRAAAASLEQEAGPLRWTLSFFDPVILPALALLDERRGPAFDGVRGLLGVRTQLYHLTLTPPADLAPHHAGHTGTALAGSQAAAWRDHEAIRAAVGPDRAALAAELEGAELAGLRRAAGLLARELAPADPEVGRLVAEGSADAGRLRRAVLHAVRGAPAGAEATGGPGRHGSEAGR